MASIFAPVIYLGIIVGGLFLFSYFYRKRIKNQRIEPYFPSHQERDTYVTLLSQSNPPAPDVILKAALIRRAMADVQRAMRIREDKPALQSLLQKGSINDSLWNSLLAAEKELEAEVLEVMHEANSFAQGWGQFIFNTAGEIVQNERTRKVFEDIPKLKAELEEKYHPKKKKVAAPVPQVPSAQADVSDEKPKIEEKESATPSTTSSTLTSSDSTKPNGLAPPPSNLDAESVTSMSDGELVSSSTPSIKNARHTPSKSNKKSKKRK